MSKQTGQTSAAFAGAVSSMHQNMHKWRDSGTLSPEDERDIDSAQVYLEAAFWKLESVLNRNRDEKPAPPVRKRCSGCGSVQCVDCNPWMARILAERAGT